MITAKLSVKLVFVPKLQRALAPRLISLPGEDRQLRAHDLQPDEEQSHRGHAKDGQPAGRLVGPPAAGQGQRFPAHHGPGQVVDVTQPDL